MKCSICGGQLSCENGIYVCLNCGTRQPLATIFENTEVFICYTEVDENGRRTKDSVIAQDIYRKLEAAKIHTFYQRISASNLTGDDCEKICTYAMDKAKILILVGSSPKYFEQLLETFRGKFVNKKIIPVYTGIDISILPTELINLQAMNYDNIGAVSNLITSILSTLGRESEIDITKITNEKIKKKKKRIGLSIVIVLLIFVTSGCYILFGTPYILKSKKYEYAESLLKDGDYIKSIEFFMGLTNYRDSDSKITQIYNLYNGYYINNDKHTQLHINITENAVIQVDLIQKTTDNKTIRFSESSSIKNNQAFVQFVDSQGNQGNAELKLTNNSINIQIAIENKMHDRTIDEGTISFSLKDKTDSLLSNLDAEALISWLKDGKSVNELNLEGIEIEQENFHPKSLSGRYVAANIKNTDITIYWSRYDDMFNLIENERDKPIIMIKAPAYILIPGKIGTPIKPFVQNDIFYMTGMDSWGGDFGYYDYPLENTKQDTNVFILYKEAFSDSKWTEIIQRPEAEG